MSLESALCPVESSQEEPPQPQPGGTAGLTLGSLILEMPSFGRMACTRRPGAQRERGREPRRCVESSSRVSRVDALKSVVNQSQTSCLFLRPGNVPRVAKAQSAGRSSSRSVQKQSASRTLVSAVRSCVPSSSDVSESVALLQRACGVYPVAPWFESEHGTTPGRRRGSSELEAEILQLTRSRFCLNARARSCKERSRTLLLTGCSSRRNVELKYSYRGFLTNQAVDPGAFGIRYSAMVETDQLCERPNASYFSSTALRTFADAFTRYKDGESPKSRSAPYAPRLKSRRHGSIKLSPSKVHGNRHTLPKAEYGPFVKLHQIGKLANHLPIGAADGTSTTEHLLLETLGEASLKVRGELLHLVFKARELEEEKQSYLAELEVVNTRVNTPKHVPFEEPAKEDAAELPNPESPPPSGAENAPDVEKSRKRKAESELSASQSAAKQQKDNKGKTKRKKEKKKKKHKKKHKKKRKRERPQHGDIAAETSWKVPREAPLNSPKHKRAEAVPLEKKEQLFAASTNEPSIPVAVPIIQGALPLGMTPINPPKNKNLQALGNTQGSQGIDPNIRKADTHPRREDSATNNKESSPDSVAILGARNASPEQPNSQMLHETNVVFRSKDHPVCELINKKSPLPIRKDVPSIEGEETRKDYDDDESCFLRSNLHGLGSEEEGCKRTLLISESFLEQHGKVIAELASGRWTKTTTSLELREITPTDKKNDNKSRNEIAICDSPLLDLTGVDIELPDNTAVIVRFMSSWLENNHHDNKGSTVSATRGAQSFMRHLISVAASGRWSSIHVILCFDVELSPDLSRNIATLQNAMSPQSCPCKEVTFEFVDPQTLAAAIAVRSASVSTAQYTSQVAEFLSDENVQERARFLIMLVPSMAVHMAARALGFSVESDGIQSNEAMQNLFSLAKSTTRDLFPFKTEGILSSLSAEQLWMTLNTQISHAR